MLLNNKNYTSIFKPIYLELKQLEFTAIHKNLLILFILFFCSTALFSISIYDIQYTTNPGGGNYPSPHEGEVVTTGGIVTGSDYNDGQYFISSSQGGAWRGIYIYDDEHTLAVGDSIIITGEVYEYYGLTEITSLSSFELISSGNSVPPAIDVSTADAMTEPYEGVLVKLNNVEVTEVYDEWNEWRVDDGSGNATISIGFLDFNNLQYPCVLGYTFSSLKGIVTYNWGNFQLNPRKPEDVSSSPESYMLSVSEQTILNNQEFEVPINLTFFGNAQVQSYQFELDYNSDVVEYCGYDTVGTLSSYGSVQVDAPSAGNLTVSFAGDFSFSYLNKLLKLNFIGLNNGLADLEFSNFIVDGVPTNYFSVEIININMGGLAIGDTITVIQRPIQSIPAILLPGDELEIECVADPSTTNWSASLNYKNRNIPLDLTNTTYDNDREKWYLHTQIPLPNIYELYDLVVDATGIPCDTTQNAVNIIPIIKDEYNFIHITDSHLPTHIFYPDPASLTDTTEMQDLREVIRDINLINPEFVLFTGDVVNEGEMEDFEDRRVYTKSQRILSSLEVPVYLVTGNHDVGGWDSSPPPQGTARRNWWRFFGWNWLEDPPAITPCYTQNYSFNYGGVHFVGLDAYLNYDDFMYNVFGDQSFTNLQMQWLDTDLQNYADSESFVLFYHYDFSDQIDLSLLDVDMALWGHIHSNSGDINVHPYNLATKGTCDGNRAYRIINVNNNQLQPTATIYAGYDGDNLQTSFVPANNGSADSVYCLVENEQDLAFPDAELKFIMPPDASSFQVSNGTLTQVDSVDGFKICYVSCDIPANGTTAVYVVASYNAVDDDPDQKFDEDNFSNFPNPFKSYTNLEFYRGRNQVDKPLKVDIYNLKGEIIKSLPINDSSNTGKISVTWNGTDVRNRKVPSGIYLYQWKLGRKTIAQKKCLLLR